jgi:hypothetical protein
MKKIIYITVLITLISCSIKNDENKTNSDYVYKPKILKRIYTETMGHEIQGFEHYVTIVNYEKFTDNFIVKYADEYRDTCKTDLPIWNIIFCEPFDFKPFYDSRDGEPLRNHSLISIGYSEETLHHDFPEIESVTFWENGKANYVQIMTLERQKRAGYYDSSGAYNRDWIKEFDKKFKTK